MCRNIRPLFNYAPAATEDEIRDASLQFVRKISGFHKPSRANQAAFDRAVEEITQASRTLLRGLTTNAPPRDRAADAARERMRAAQRIAGRA